MAATDIACGAHVERYTGPARGDGLYGTPIGLNYVEIMVQIRADQGAGQLNEIGTLSGTPRAFR